MCGIFGLVVQKEPNFGPEFIKKSFTALGLLSESRGKDASGIAFRNESDRELRVAKGTIPISRLLKNKEIVCRLNNMVRQQGIFAAMGHARLVTNGSQINNENNQPVVKDGIVGVHNGIIVNEKELWSRHPEIQKIYEIDTEIMLALISSYIREGKDIGGAISKTVNEIFGTATVAFFIDSFNALALATNNGSLYILIDKGGLFAFASEEYFLKKLAKTMHLDKGGGFCIQHVVPNKGVILDLERFQLQEFSFLAENQKNIEKSLTKIKPYKIATQSFLDKRPQKELILDPAAIVANPKTLTESALLEFNIEQIRELRRCNRCLLPETFPFIEFDGQGLCNYCKNYKIKNNPKPVEELFDLVNPYRRNDGRPDCIVPYSGGRDSTHTLHIVKNVLKLNPIAFTYDWGMVNDLARRNVARVCGKLGVENIIVSANISWKRENIRRNILAWLRNPNLGMVPLFMAGDKYFFYYCNQIKKQTGIRLNIWGVNPLENTEFKVGFLGVPPDHHKKYIYSLSAKRKASLISSTIKNIVANPYYLNRSVWDTLGSFIVRNIIPQRDYYHLYDYYRWDEQEIEKLVLEEYLWERAIDTKTTWRIGDGTAPFYNYIYYTVAGFSEYDTFRSNQIREGMLTREEGMKLIMEENRPRYLSIKWYLDIIGLDYEGTIKTINRIPKLYGKIQ